MHKNYNLVSGKIKTDILEVTIVEHCNLSCRDCNHLSPIIPQTMANPDFLLRDLKSLSSIFHTNCVKLLGGEPLLHPRILEIIQLVKKSCIADCVGIETNGLLLGQMGDSFWKSIDLIIVSAYPGREPSENLLKHCRKMSKIYHVDFTVILSPIFRIAYSESGESSTQLVHDIYSTCQMAHTWCCQTLANGYFFKCPLAYYIPRAILPIGKKLATADGVSVKTTDGLEKRLLSYLNSNEPLMTCRHCLGTVGISRPWEELKRQNWRSDHCRPIKYLLDSSLLQTLKVKFI